MEPMANQSDFFNMVCGVFFTDGWVSMIAAFDGVEVGSQALRLLRVQFLVALLYRRHEHWAPEVSYVSH